jgi:multidrug efflux system membrane fusion protein
MASIVLFQVNHHPRTDDASVYANYIQFAPEVSGRVAKLAVKDNQYVQKGTLLFTIDPRSYEYTLQQALADQQLLEKQIGDAERRIAAESSAVEAANAGLTSSQMHLRVVTNGIAAAHAVVVRAQAAVETAVAQRTLASNNLHRIEPLLAKQYVTQEQVDEVRTKSQIAEQGLLEAQAALQQAQAQEEQARTQHLEARAGITMSQANLNQSIHAVDTLDSLKAQRPIKAAQVLKAQLDLERCRVATPFDGYITNLTISEGEYAKPGIPIFTLIDTRNWYVIASYRESDLRFIRPGRHVDLYLMGDPGRRFDGYVESVGFGVTPDDSKLSNGLPDIDHTLNWVHLAARFPVRVKVQNPDPLLFRMGETAISIVR